MMPTFIDKSFLYYLDTCGGRIAKVTEWHRGAQLGRVAYCGFGETSFTRNICGGFQRQSLCSKDTHCFDKVNIHRIVLFANTPPILQTQTEM